MDRSGRGFNPRPAQGWEGNPRPAQTGTIHPREISFRKSEAGKIPPATNPPARHSKIPPQSWAGVDRSGRGFNPRPAQGWGFNLRPTQGRGEPPRPAQGSRPAREIALLLLTTLVVLLIFLVRNDAAAATYQHCPDGLCKPALLCPPWTTWDDNAKQCRTVRACPGESQVLVSGGECELYCRLGNEPDPFRPNYCRPAFQCPPGRVEVEPNVCEIPCPEGERQNPWRQGVCRAFQCPFGQVEVAEGVCQSCPGGFCECPQGAEGDQCRELDRSHGAVAVNLHFAHEKTMPDGTPLLGNGAIIAVMEAGALHWIPGGDPGETFDPNAQPSRPATHSELPQMPVFGYDPNDPALGANKYDGTPAGASHAIAVVGIMAAKKNGIGVVGIAPEADYMFGNVNGTIPDFNLMRTATERGAHIINNSWTPELFVTARDFVEGADVLTRANLRDFGRRNAMAAVYQIAGITVHIDELLRGKFTPSHSLLPAADRPIYVWTTGNNRGRTITVTNITVQSASDYALKTLSVGTTVDADSPGGFSGLPEFFPELTLNNIAVAAVRYELDSETTAENGETLRQSSIADFSNLCGGQSFCLAAPGVAGFEFTDEEEALVQELAWQELIKVDTECADPLFSGRFECAQFRTRRFKPPHYAALFAQKFLTGMNADFVLAPETEDYGQNEGRAPTGYDRTRGTSIAAPIVSGALALMRQYFADATNCGAGNLCGLGAHELVARILATADKRGIYADSQIYGAGLLDLRNALTPQGELRLLFGRGVADSKSHPLSQSALKTGPAFGDSIADALRDVRVAAFDEMSAPFPISAAVLIQSESEPENNSLREALSAMQLSETAAPKAKWDFDNGFAWLALRGANFPEPLQSETVFGANGYANPYSSPARSGFAAGMEWDVFRMEMFGDASGQDSRTRGMVASFSPMSFKSRLAKGGGGWRFHFGGVEEANGFLSSSGVGAFAGLRARTRFVGADYVGEKINGWRIRAGGFAGSTSAKDGNEGGWFSEVGSLRSDSFHLGLERENVLRFGDGLGFRVYQPLRVSESFRFRIPTGRTRYGDLTWREISGAASGRELALEGLYRAQFDGGRWLLSSGLISQSGHRADAGTIGRILFAFEREF